VFRKFGSWILAPNLEDCRFCGFLRLSQVVKLDDYQVYVYNVKYRMGGREELNKR